MNYLEKMTREYFQSGLTIPEYMKELRNYRSLVKKLLKSTQAEDEQVELLKEKLQGLHGPISASAQTEDWCGDWAANMPYLNDFFDRAGVEFRVFRGESHPELKERYRREGVGHIPVISLWDVEGEEIARWVEAPRKVAAMKTRWKKEHPQLMELYDKQADDRQAAKEFAKLYRVFLERMIHWYKEEGMWRETGEEIIRGIRL
ncbi:MAG TPA: hypothetical protein ENN41_03145 [Sediminispirochaeta sp.]|nr:hypothetical protein [Sediminispirochaeta sp.]